MKKLISLCALFALTTVMALAADVTGTWKGEANPNGKGGPPTFTLKQSGETLTGSTTGRGGETAISNGKVDGDKVYFEVTREVGGNTVTAKYTGTVSGSTMKLSYDAGRGPRDMTLTKQ
jgi:opacity protein-like surface antigen